MSKAEGKKIAIKFSAPVFGDLSLLPQLPLTQNGVYKKPTALVTASNYYTTYYPQLFYDGNATTTWYTRAALPQWVQFTLLQPTRLAGFRWYCYDYSTYRPNAFTLQGSNDGITWVNMYTGASANSAGWKEFFFNAECAYLYFRFTITTKHGTYLFMNELEFYVKEQYALRLTGLQFDEVKLDYVEKTYEIQTVENHPTIANTLLITLHPFWGENFDSVVGNLKLQYVGATGNLVGTGGAVEDFVIEFTPTDLIETNHPYEQETVSVGIECTSALIPVIGHSVYCAQHTISAAAFEIITSVVYSDLQNP